MSASDSTHLVHVVARDRARRATARAIDRPRRLRLVAGALVGRAGRARRRVRARAPGRRRRRLRACAPARCATRSSSDRAAGLRAGDRHERRRHAPGPARSIPSPPSRDIAREHGLWHHVDAAWAGSAMLCEEQRAAPGGRRARRQLHVQPAQVAVYELRLQRARGSADRAPLIASLSILPPYLRNAASESGEVIDYRDWHVPLGRRFRALKLWWVLRSYGAAGCAEHLREHIALAERARAARRRAPAPRAGRAGLVRARLPRHATATPPPTPSPRRSTRTRTST